MRVVLLDNRDSFVYNLVDQFASLGAGIEVYRSTAAASTVMAALAPTAAERAAGQRPVLCLSPGPGHPRTSGCLMELVEAALVSAVPTLGICLGFQAIVEACGGSVGPVGPVHGRSVRVEVTEAGRADPAFLPLAGGPLDVARYHSLGTRALPAALTCLARTYPSHPSHDGVDRARPDGAATVAPVGDLGDTGPATAPAPGIVMAARHVSAPLVGLQFHPESVLTPQGPAILRALTQDLARPAPR